MPVVACDCGVAHGQCRYGQKGYADGVHRDGQSCTGAQFFDKMLGQGIGVALQQVKGPRRQAGQQEDERQEDAREKA